MCTAQLRMQFENCDSYNLYLDNQSRNCYSCLGSIGHWPASRSSGSGTRKRSRSSNCFFVAYMSRRDAKCDLEHIVDKNVIMIRPPSGLSAPIRPILQHASVCQAEAAEDDFQGLRGSRWEESEILTTPTWRSASSTEQSVLTLIQRMIEFVIWWGEFSISWLNVAKESHNDQNVLLEADDRSANHESRNGEPAVQRKKKSRVHLLPLKVVLVDAKRVERMWVSHVCERLDLETTVDQFLHAES